MAHTPRSVSLYVQPTDYSNRSQVSYSPRSQDQASARPQAIRSISPENLQKLKYKIALG
jgi:hypothetical protein